MTRDLIDTVDAIISRAAALKSATDETDLNQRAGLEKIQTAAGTFRGLLDQLASNSEALGSEVLLTPHVRHDLANPVNQIIGYAEMLIEDAEDAGTPGPVEDLTQIVSGARHLALSLARESAPAKERSTSRTGSPAARRPAPTSVHPLLVVDDDALNCDLLTNRLERQGFEVLTAHDGLRALEILERQPIDLVLLDVLMPKMDGYQVLERMKANPALHDVPVLMISGLHEVESVVRCIEMGADDYLPKPFNPVLLQARLGACLERKQLRDQERQTFHALKASQEALAAELAEAAEYVRSLLPPPIQTEDVALSWRFIPSTQLGGDAFGYQWLDADHLAVYLFDVCGHGVGAALLSASIINLLRSGRLGDADLRRPAEVLQALNKTFQMEQQNGNYFTIWYGVYKRRSRMLDHASGGHPPAVLLTGDAAALRASLLRHPGLIIGADPDVTYQQASTLVPPGSRLYIFSDGLFETKTPHGGMLDFAAFVEMFTTPAAPSQSTLDRLIGDLRALGGTEAFDDDVSIMEIRFA